MDSTFAEQRKKEIAENKVVVYGKGTKLMPMCGFTAQVVEVFKRLGKPFEVVNVLDDPEFRPQMKEFSSWPTFPQIYIDGELVGGCDIALEMYNSGELEQLLQKAFPSE